MPRHDVQPDGYCATCRTIPCRARNTSGGQVSAPAGPTQLDRIEALLRQIARKLDIEVGE